MVRLSMCSVSKILRWSATGTKSADNVLFLAPAPDWERCYGLPIRAVGRFEACPYDARYFNEDTGTTDKYTGCVHRVYRGEEPGTHPAVYYIYRGESRFSDQRHGRPLKRKK
ncbi:MAG: hypothetical protein GXO75_07075 [Calditrichaeota bacterium]|nr:hypothetical protein [Calditrichota bacterium]